jgi:hypothetical protein
MLLAAAAYRDSGRERERERERERGLALMLLAAATYRDSGGHATGLLQLRLYSVSIQSLLRLLRI